MEFNCDIIKILPGRMTVLEFKNSDDKLYVYDLEDNFGADKNWICDLINPKLSSDADIRSKRENLEKIIDQMGHASARAQDLKSPITTFLKFYNSIYQKIYVMRDTKEPYSVIGMLKIGRTRIFIRDNANAHYEVDATCILDFYIHESKQHKGFGHFLFNAMLKEEKIKPSELAVDRPSHKLLAFLSKHYGLKDPIPQANNFAVYLDLFKDSKKISDNAFPDWNNDLFDPSKKAPVSEKVEKIGSLDDYFRKQRPPTRTYVDGNQYTNQHCSWGVFDSMHTYSNKDAKSDAKIDSKNDISHRCSPGDDATHCCPEKKHQQLSSSMNVHGVKPPVYQ